MIKFDQKATRECYENSLKAKRGICTVATQPSQVEDTTRAKIVADRRPEPAGEIQEREIGGRKFKLGKSLSQDLQDRIAKVITRHLNAFAWSASDMSGIDP